MSKKIISLKETQHTNKVIPPYMRLSKEEENKIIALRNAIDEGVSSEINENFNPKKHLQTLKNDIS